MSLPTYLMSNFPSVRPSLNLQFDSQPTPEDMTSHLASVGATFSRASIGTYVDANGIIQEATAGQARPNYSTAGVHEGLLIEESRTNLVKSSEDFSSNQWTTTATTVTANQAISPDGLAGADKVTKLPSGENDRVKDGINILNSTDYTISVFVKNDDVSEYTTIGARISGGTLFRKTIDWNSSATPTLDTTYDSGSPSNVFLEDYGNGWYRFGFSFTSDGTDMDFEVDVDRGTTGRNEASSLYLWGAQLEEGSFPTSYIPTIPTFTSRASDGTYFDSSGVLQTTSGERIDHKYIDGQWVEAGLLLEGSATNELVYSEDFTSVGGSGSGQWSAQSGATITTNQAVAPDGTTTADLIDISATNSHHIQYIADHISADETWTFSCWVKKATSSGDFAIKIDGTDVTETKSDVITLTDEWQRLEVTATFDSSIGGGNWVYVADSRIGGVTATDVYVWGAQFELGSQPTSYIATSGSTATRSADVYTTATKQRSADVCYIDGTAFTDFYNQEEGTVFFNGKNPDHQGVNNERFYFLAKTGDNKVQLTKVTLKDKIRLVIEKNDVQGDNNMDVSGGSTFKHAVAFFNDSTVSRHVLNGTQQTNISAPDTFSENLDNFGIGQIPNDGRQINSTIKKIIYFPRSLSDNELIKLTQ